MTAIIKIPTIWSCHTRDYGWLNLAKARRVQPCPDIKKQPCILITWENGDEELFRGDDAQLIMRSWLDAVDKYIHPYEGN